MKLTKEQKSQLAEDLSLPWGAVELLCDGYRIGLQVQRTKGLTYRIVIFVNGKWEGRWLSGVAAYPEQKFLRKVTLPVCRPSMKARAVKIFGKRAVAKDPYYSETFVTYRPDWPSGKAALNHLCRVCESVEIAPGKDVAA